MRSKLQPCISSLDENLKEKMRNSRRQSISRFGEKIDFYITSGFFPAVSLTGKNCSLQCNHCKGKLLENIASTSRPEEFALKLFKEGARGILLTGGCDLFGRVPINPQIVKQIKESTGMTVIAHTGFISEREAFELKSAGLDGIGIDVVGDASTAKRVYGLDVQPEDYIRSLKAVESAGIPVLPHVCVGLDYGKIKGEFNALDMIRCVDPKAVIITGIMPVSGTPMEQCKPDPLDFIDIICRATEIFGCPVILGCARSMGSDREFIDIIGIESGITGIAIPTGRAIRYAQEKGLTINYHKCCCGADLLDD